MGLFNFTGGICGDCRTSSSFFCNLPLLSHLARDRLPRRDGRGFAAGFVPRSPKERGQLEMNGREYEWNV
jgi:hypothetical protein